MTFASRRWSLISWHTYTHKPIITGTEKGKARVPYDQSVQLAGSSVPVPWHFDTVSYPRIRTTGLRILIRILPLSSVTFKMPTKYIFFRSFFCLLPTVGTFTFQRKQNFRLEKFKGFLNFLLVDQRIRILIRTKIGAPVFAESYSGLAACRLVSAPLPRITAPSQVLGRFDWLICCPP